MQGKKVVKKVERAKLAQRSHRYRQNGGIELRIYKHNATCVMTLEHLSRTPNTRDGVCICQDAILQRVLSFFLACNCVCGLCNIEANFRQLRLIKSFDSLNHKSTALQMLNKTMKKANFNIKCLYSRLPRNPWLTYPILP